MTLLALLPQAHLWYTRGGDWQGAYASFDGDETAYAAYLAALIEGRPRLNDPYAGLTFARRAPARIALLDPVRPRLRARAARARARPRRLDRLRRTQSPRRLRRRARALLAARAAPRRRTTRGVRRVIILCLGALASGEVESRAAPQVARVSRLPVVPAPLRARAALPLLFIFCALVWRALAHASRARHVHTPSRRARRSRSWSIPILSLDDGRRVARLPRPAPARRAPGETTKARRRQKFF
jgi:hypothetical protein